MKQDLQRNEDGSIYNSIGLGYARTRREDPKLYDRIQAALGNSQSVVNIGAGTGSYEPKNLCVLAVEPSEVMASQRGPDAAPVIQAKADKLPLHDKSFDAAMTVFSIHHWHPHLREGIAEMVRVSRKRIVIVTYDTRVSNNMWLLSDYFPETAKLDSQIFPYPETICSWLNKSAQVQIVPNDRNTPDWTIGSFWAHPERVLDPVARAATSGFSRQSADFIQRVASNVEHDLKSGEWDRKYGYLRKLDEFDVGLRIITAECAR
ncbi:MAG TPA: methyltransferase domain-containing protein [Bdellovibrio sp.]|nr:methyltransferase domain-containing protein [Bdellovibrio sp.]